MLSGIEAAPWCKQASKQSIKQSINMQSVLFNFKPFTQADSRLNLVAPTEWRPCLSCFLDVRRLGPRRDFVSVRHWRTKDKVIMSARVGVHHPDCPPSRKHVRGHNKPGGWFFAPSSEGADHCLFGWLMCTDLRSWLPQALIDKAIPKMLMDFVTHLNVHVSKEKREGN